ncbi:hypothetical protein EON65_25475 [archaeon]|nr:MAG: hypothetical protein EON65_25475 [archaeon]
MERSILPPEPTSTGVAINSILSKPSRKVGTEGTSSTDNSSSTTSTSSSGFASKLFDKITPVGKVERLERSPEENVLQEPPQSSTAAKPTDNKTLPIINKTPCCDKCDGKHETDNCPHYKKKREDHPDAQRRKPIGGTSSLPGSYITTARVARQPGDGSCLFHSISYGLNRAGSSSYQSASSLRQVVTQYIRCNPTTLICDTPIQDWVKWDSGTSVSDYSRKIASGAWGGGIEMACLSLILSCNIHVYERQGGGYRRISAFDCATNAESRPIVRVLYCGGVHYGKLNYILLNTCVGYNYVTVLACLSANGS